MLGKLLKHDFKDAKILLLVYGVSILLSTISFLVYETGLIYSANVYILIIICLQVFATILSLFAVIAVSLIMVVLSFGKHTIGSQGQLMFTLPITIDQFLISKLISSVIIMSASVFYVFAWLTSLVSIVSPQIFAQINDVPDFSIAVIFLVCELIGGIVTSLLMFYASIALSGRISQNRILGSIVAYIAISFIMQIILTLLFIVGGAMYAFTNEAAATSVGDIVNIFSGISAVSIIGMSILFYFITRRELSKKINLP